MIQSGFLVNSQLGALPLTPLELIISKSNKHLLPDSIFLQIWILRITRVKVNVSTWWTKGLSDTGLWTSVQTNIPTFASTPEKDSQLRHLQLQQHHLLKHSETLLTQIYIKLIIRFFITQTYTDSECNSCFKKSLIQNVLQLWMFEV